MSGFVGADYGMLAAYAIAVLAIGLYAARDHTNAQDLLLGRRAVPVWAVLCSMVATELSAATFIGVPVAAYLGTWSYLQFAFGALAGKLVLARLVIPLYHRLEVVTVYGFLDSTCGPHTRRFSAAAFAGGRLLASGVRLFIAALACSLVTGLSIEGTIVLSGLLAVAYTRIGGIRSVIFTDTLQAMVLLVAVVALLFAVVDVEGGADAVWSWASASGKTEIFQFAPLLTLDTSLAFGSALIGGFFLTLATHATDHDMVQRLLTARSGRSGGLALVGSGLLNFPLTAMFLFVGTGIAHFYATPPGYDISASDQILPVFAMHELPAGLRGLVFAGLFAAAMSSLDSAICAIATTWVIDVHPSPKDLPDEQLARRLNRVATIAGFALIASALLMAYVHTLMRTDANGPTLVEFALSSMSILYGGLLGIFARGLLAPHTGDDRAAVTGLAVGSLIGLGLFLHPAVLGQTWSAWPYWIPIAASATFGLACLSLDQPDDKTA